MGKKDDSISDIIQSKIDGADYGRGRLEAADATAGNAAACLGNLVQLLVEKGVVLESEIEEKILDGIY